MTTLQEAAMRQSFETWAKPILGDNPTWKESGECELAWQSWKAALAQHREQQPVCHGCGIPAGDVHMRTCKSGKWPSRVSNGDTAAPAPQPEPAGWQKIETAPEGTMILCANMKAMDARSWAYVAWIAGGKVCGYRMDMPTHWMPLPTPPKEQQ